VLKAFVDDSGSDMQGPVYILAGYVSDVDSWDRFTIDWDRALHEIPAIEYFKMQEAESGKGQFDGWSDHAIESKVRSLIPIICKYAKNRIECIFWQEHYDVAHAWFLVQIQKQMTPLVFSKVRRIFSDPYFLAFCLIMSQYALALEMERSDEIADFVFDTQGKVGNKCVEWWKRMNDIISFERYQKHIPHEPVYRDEKLFLPLQAADLLAWQTRRRLWEYHERHIEQKREEMKMLEVTPLFPNRWNEQRLREFFGTLLVPVRGEAAL
jgi:hypothetical protein